MNMLYTVGAMTVTCFVLSGCLGPGTPTRELAASDCVAYGFQPGTTSYAQCVLLRDQQRTQSRERALRNLQKTVYCSDPYYSGSALCS